MKILKTIFFIFIYTSFVFAQEPVPLTVEEVDGSPSVPLPWKMIMPNSSLTDNSDGTVRVDFVTTGTIATTGTIYTNAVETYNTGNVDFGGSNLVTTGTINTSSTIVCADLVVDTDTLFVNGTSGNVGIGTTTPDAKLEVGGAVRVTTASDKIDWGGISANNAYIIGADTIAGFVSTPMHLSSETNSGMVVDIRSNGAGDRFSIRTTAGGYDGVADTVSFTVDGVGNVGIGTTAPIDNLHILGSGGAISGLDANANDLIILENTGYSFINVAGTTVSGILFSNSVRSVGSIQFQHTDNSIIFKHGGNEDVRIASDGNVGIGTTIPGFALHTYHATDNEIARFESGDAGARIGIKDTTDTAYIVNQAATVSIGMFNVLDAGNFNIDALGQVGVGITAPAAQVDIVDTITGDGYSVKNTANFNPSVSGSPSASGYGYYLLHDIGGSNNASGSDAIRAYGLAIDSNFGAALSNSGFNEVFGTDIDMDFDGSISDTATLNMYGEKINVGSDLGTVGLTEHIGSSITATGTADKNTGLIVSASGATNNYAALFTGLVGIGSSAPTAALDVVGDITTTGTINTTGSILINADMNGLVLGSGQDYEIDWDGSDAVHTISTGNFLFNNGNLGIGTDTPAYKLDVWGSLFNDCARIYSTGASSALIFSDTDGTQRGAVYSDYSGFGLMNNSLTWAIEVMHDTTNIDMPGSLTVGGSIMADSIKSNATIGIDFGLSNLTTTGTINTTGSILLDADWNSLVIGDGQDLELYHNGTDSYIETNTGDLYLETTGTVIINAITTINVNDDVNINGGGLLVQSDLLIDTGEITSVSGGISFGNENLTTTGTLTTSGTATVGAVNISPLPPVYANNAAAVSGGLVAGDLYRSGGDPDVLYITH